MNVKDLGKLSQRPRVTKPIHVHARDTVVPEKSRELAWVGNGRVVKALSVEAEHVDGWWGRLWNHVRVPGAAPGVARTRRGDFRFFFGFIDARRLCWAGGFVDAAGHTAVQRSSGSQAHPCRPLTGCRRHLAPR